jgi:hypothetical protein
MELTNPTFERFEEQYDSQMYDFKPQSSIAVPEWPKEIGQGLLSRLSRCGIFDSTGMDHDSDEFKRAENQALKKYLEGRNAMKIANFDSHYDALDKGGKTFEKDYAYLKAQKWKKEINQRIGYQEEKMGDDSFLPKKKKEKAE